MPHAPWRSARSLRFWFALILPLDSAPTPFNLSQVGIEKIARTDGIAGGTAGFVVQAREQKVGAQRTHTQGAGGRSRVHNTRVGRWQRDQSNSSRILLGASVKGNGPRHDCFWKYFELAVFGGRRG